MNKEQLLAEILADLYERGKWKVLKGGMPYVEKTGDSGAQENNEANSRKHRNDSILIGSEGTSGNSSQLGE
ncbi:hypothetical protein Tmel_1475 [Thermosipho melanesiensis BI429]|uniref:Uncharacterized protein n=2 Tax=Thermosipho melanesiensis TaxID=46541 RepID=A6LN21_THEM4|nr:hypothetical protein Tmel_1475 [Thermosipho melanesiensis BI429]